MEKYIYLDSPKSHTHTHTSIPARLKAYEKGWKFSTFQMKTCLVLKWDTALKMKWIKK